MCGQLTGLFKGAVAAVGTTHKSELLKAVSFLWRVSHFLTVFVLIQEKHEGGCSSTAGLCPCLWLAYSHRVPVVFLVLTNASLKVLDWGVTEIRVEIPNCI